MALYIFLFISAVFNVIVGSVIGIIIYLKDKKNVVNRTFAVFCFFITTWSMGYFFPIVQNSESLSLLSFRLLHVGAAFIAVAHFHFVCAVLDIVKEKKKYIIFAYLFNLLIVLFFIPTKLFISEVVPKGDFNYWANVGIAYKIWLAVWLSYVVASVYLLYAAYKKTKGIKKQQIKYILIGDMMTFGTGSMNYFLFFDINVTPYLTIFASGQMFSIFYIIVRYRFIDIKLNSLEVLKKVFSIILSVVTAYLIYTIYSFFFPFSAKLDIPTIVGIAILIIFFLIFNNVVRLKFFYNFFRLSNFEYFKQTVFEFKNRNSFYHSIEEFQMNIKKTFCDKLQISSAFILILDEETGRKYPELIKYFLRDKSFLVTEELELEQKTRNKKFSFFKELKSLGKICFPLFFKSERNLIGFFVLGEKPFQNPYTKEELEVLESTAYQISLFLAVILYNFELQKQVKIKTQALKEQNKEMQKLLRQQSDFIAVTAHEFRTPLSIALFQLDDTLNSSKNNIDETEKNDLQIMKASLDNLKSLTQKLFDVQQYDLNKVNVKCEIVNIVEFLEKIYKDFINIMSEKSINLHFVNKIEGKCYVNIDKLQIRQVFHNVLNNAFKFTPKDGTIVIKLITINSHVLISVSDTGQGISDTERELIFNKFQTKKASMAMGIGLGLYISKKIIELHKGEIWVENAEIGGAKFCIKLKISNR
ncbi:hypothetical protein A2335_00710 [Candidatus Peregrinibacteria bacterium RIFOXYB2_FULL_32_7]|nr:MAG: hypothetical protein A2335_00710 [Candidatus Peregrinibacteria bacterium RIFOXYB2_FULL_32_7]